MIAHVSCRTRLSLAAVFVVVATVGCTDAAPQTGLGSQQLAISPDTLPGTGSLSELQQHRAAWLARGINDYRVQLQISCFCGGDITRPVLIEVRGGVVTKVWDLEKSKPVADITPYPSVTKLFDAAIAERSRGGNVTVAYDQALGIPIRLEVGTVANDAGVMYFLSGLSRL